MSIKAPNLVSISSHVAIDTPNYIAGEWLDIENMKIDSYIFPRASKVSVRASVLQNVVMDTILLEKCEMTNVLVRKGTFVGLGTYGASIQKVHFQDCRMTGIDFAEALLEDCIFEGVKIDEASFKMAKLKRVQFKSCVLNTANFYSSFLKDVSFDGCQMEGAMFDQAACKDVDLTRQDVMDIKGFMGLRGATLSEGQVVQIAPFLVTELGFKIQE